MVERGAIKKYTQEEFDQSVKDGIRDFSGCDLSGLSFKDFVDENLVVFAEMNLNDAYLDKCNLDFDQTLLARLKGAYTDSMVAYWGITCSDGSVTKCSDEEINRLFSVSYKWEKLYKETENGKFLTETKNGPRMSMKPYFYLKPALELVRKNHATTKRLLFKLFK